MKLITLNTWCGKIHEPLKNFIIHHSSNTEFFCFQEVRNGKYLNQKEEIEEAMNLFNEIEVLLPNFKGHYAEMSPGVGIAIFVNKNIQIEDIKISQILSREEIINLKMANGSNYYPRIMQSIKIKNTNLVIHNFHGVPGSFKKDIPERELQIKKILEVMKSYDNFQQIIVGDFNLDMNTKAIDTLGEKMRNLVKESEFKTTRNDNYQSKSIMPFADYIFVSKDINVQNFIVLNDEVSDHLALLLEFK